MVDGGVAERLEVRNWKRPGGRLIATEPGHASVFLRHTAQRERLGRGMGVAVATESDKGARWPANVPYERVSQRAAVHAAPSAWLLCVGMPRSSSLRARRRMSDTGTPR